MTDYAWMSITSANVDIIRSLRSKMSFSEDEAIRKLHLDASNAAERGERFPVGGLPDTFFAWRGQHDSSRALTKKMPHLTNSGFWFVTDEVAKVMRQFDLGNSQLHSVDVLMEDRQTPLPGKYFVLKFDSWKNVFLPDASPDIRMMRGSKTRRSPSLSTPDDAAVLSRDALVGPDIWWNLDIIHAFFLSDRLVQALRAAKVDKPFDLKRCLIA